MDFRLYDGALGRFFGIDLLADMFTSHSPYHFAYNNPVSFMDPTGLHIDPAEPTQQSGTTDWGTDWEFEEGGDGLPVLVIDVNRKYWRPSREDSPGAYTMNVMVISHGYGGSRGGGGGGSGSGGSNGASNNSTAPDFTKEMELVGNAGTATSIIEQGAKRGERLYSQEAVKNSNAAKNAVKSANLAKWMSRAGNAVNVVTIGTEFINTLNNPNATGADYAKIGAKVGVAYLSNAINVAAPGLGIIVGIGLNYLIDEYGGAIYESVAEGFNNNRLAL